MQQFPLVSIVTPTFNQATYLAQTIDSVLCQDYPNIEYIVIDDGSTDSTPEVLSRYSGKVRWERHENMGQALTLNKGWAISTGCVMGYLSSDDILYPGAVSKLVAILERDNSVACVYPDAHLIDNISHVVKRNVCRPFDLTDLVIRQECYIGPGALFRRDAFDLAGGWKSELKLAPDREFWMRLAEYGRIEFCQDVLAGYRIHPESISYKDVSEAIGREYLFVLDQYFDSSSVPADLVVRKSEAYGYAHLILARNCFRAGLFRRGWELYEEACRIYPPLRSTSVKARILRNVVSKPLRIALATCRSVFKS
ncbi:MULTISPECIES: glycosyltransferase [unclassified Polynucleobacter]|uniref:glycosyltransferase n=1 Tax=unclassified Polynucleobacter TaxID=2640945 RepID=UPI000BC87AC4|nr:MULTISPECIES: glycosyltransferase [unclassified Polynucleobacter]OYY13151.1 MAG: hypothetical protein B7Y67_12730 [Polynucleobacter sp. 35-46-11]OZA76462.1 MAG: hypothetical protein B7X71_08325 [Polynucleobacter sp. 39-46-10]